MKFTKYTSKQIEKHTSIRLGETKIGEQVSTVINDYTEFVLLGISEDIGPRANLGQEGAKNAFDAFLGKFLNMQSNRFLSGENICVLGEIFVTETKDCLKKQVELLDDLVFQTLQKEMKTEAQLIVIGGGHNNALPILHFFAEKKERLHILNIDPHSDTRATEGRHSGNPFSTAILNDWVNSYAVIGLHEQYNNDFIYDFLEKHECSHTFFEEYLDGNRDLIEDISSFKEKYKDDRIGVEIDLDAITRMPTSAFSPSGFNVEIIRSSIRILSGKNVRYLHLPEGAPKNEQEKTIVGKSLAYIVSDFIKSSMK